MKRNLSRAPSTSGKEAAKEDLLSAVDDLDKDDDFERDEDSDDPELLF